MTHNNVPPTARLDGIEARAGRATSPTPGDGSAIDCFNIAAEVVPALVAGFREILALHVEIEYPFPDDDGEPIRGCSGCGGRMWPCPTVRAVEAALGEDRP